MSLTRIDDTMVNSAFFFLGLPLVQLSRFYFLLISSVCSGLVGDPVGSCSMSLCVFISMVVVIVLRSARGFNCDPFFFSRSRSLWLLLAGPVVTFFFFSLRASVRLLLHTKEGGRVQYIRPHRNKKGGKPLRAASNRWIEVCFTHIVVNDKKNAMEGQKGKDSPAKLIREPRRRATRAI